VETPVELERMCSQKKNVRFRAEVLVSKDYSSIHHTCMHRIHIKVHTVTGASTRCTFDSSTRISRALRHKALTSPSRKYSHLLSRSICSSKQLFPPLVNDVAVMLVVSGSMAAEGESAAGFAGAGGPMVNATELK